MAHASRLSSGTLVPIVLSSIPPSPEPALKSAWDALALLCHACLLSVDFRLIGLGEEHRISRRHSYVLSTEPLTTKADASSDANEPQPLPAEWNESRSSDYAFRYKHPQSSMEYLLKISKLGGKVIISGLGIGDDRVRTYDAPVKDFVSTSAFPLSLPPSDTDNDARKKAIQDLFISEGRIADFAALFKLKIIQALLPALQKEGYEETETSQRTSSSSNTRRDPERGDREDPSRQPPHDPLPPYAQPRPPLHDPLAEPPRRPVPMGDFPPPGFEDEHEILGPRYRPGYAGGAPRMPMSGQQDLYPPGMGPNDPLRMGPRGGGMHPTFDDPIFGGAGGVGGYHDDR